MTILQQRNTVKPMDIDYHKKDDPDSESLLKHEKKTLSWNEIPAWMQDNAYITAGYRPQLNSYKECINSLWYLHNESVNIWSHFLTFLIFVGLGTHFYWFTPFKESLTLFDYVYFYCFIFGALICLGFSATFHCFAAHSERVCAAWNRCDYAGITCLIVGSFFPIVYYGLHCHHLLQIFYLATICILGAITAAVTLMRHFRTPAYRWVRATLFISLGSFGIIPTVHGISAYGLDNAHKTIALGHMALMGCTYIGGALLYGLRFPERVFPGKCNIFGSSHQIFHLCVSVAVITNYLGIMSAMSFWHDVSNQSFCQDLFLL